MPDIPILQPGRNKIAMMWVSRRCNLLTMLLEPFAPELLCHPVELDDVRVFECSPVLKLLFHTLGFMSDQPQT